MRILVFWRRGHVNQRETVVDHAMSFARYDNKNEYYYFDIYNGRYPEDYEWISDGMFDAFLFDYSVFEVRYSSKRIHDFACIMNDLKNRVSGVRIMITQDDYSLTERLWDFAKKAGINKIYTPMKKEDYSIVYPNDRIEGIDVETVYVGYVEESWIERIPLKPHAERIYDVVYRGGKLPYVFGKLGQLKHEIADVFNDKLKDKGLRTDIASTIGNHKAILGEAWLNFLASSRITIGCLSGSGILDIDGSLEASIDEYLSEYPDSTYDEVKNKVFPNNTEPLHGVISPRVFECALMKTCQVLVGDDYQGVLRPDRDYIMVENDFRNIDEVIEKIQDVSYCEEIAENCYNTTVKSGNYSYRVFVDRIISDISSRIDTPSKTEVDRSYITEMCKKNNDNVYAEMIEKALGENHADH